MALTTADIARFGAALAPLLRDSCQVVRNVGTDPDAPEDWQPVGSAVACELDPLGASEVARLANLRFEDSAPYKLLFPAGTDVRERDRVVVNGTRTLEVRQSVRTGANEVERVVYAVERVSG